MWSGWFWFHYVIFRSFMTHWWFCDYNSLRMLYFGNLITKKKKNIKISNIKSEKLAVRLEHFWVQTYAPRIWQLSYNWYLKIALHSDSRKSNQRKHKTAVFASYNRAYTCSTPLRHMEKKHPYLTAQRGRWVL